MNHEILYPLAMIAVGALITFALRSAPFLLFGSRPLPDVMHYLSRYLPPAIMTVLVLYCLRNISLTRFPFGIPEIIYMILIRVPG